MTAENFPGRLFKMTKAFYREVPSTAQAHDFTDRLVNFLFPLREKKNPRLKEMELRWEQLQDYLLSIITPLCRDRQCCCRSMRDEFFSEIPLLYAGLMQDAENYLECDPAANGTEEVVLCYPGFYAVMVHRIANLMLRTGIPILPRVISEYAHSQTGIDIHPGARIGRYFYIDHGTGIVIGETAVIGNNVKIYQGVTLGATFVEKQLKGVRRHPEIEDDVIIYAGATILGGNTVIGRASVIGGNVWLTGSVPPFSRIYHKPEVVVREGKNIPEVSR